VHFAHKELESFLEAGSVQSPFVPARGRLGEDVRLNEVPEGRLQPLALLLVRDLCRELMDDPREAIHVGGGKREQRHPRGLDPINHDALEYNVRQQSTAYAIEDFWISQQVVLHGLRL
jgi:hypothetical protein